MSAFEIDWKRLLPDGSRDADYLRSLHGPHRQPPQFPIDTSARFTPAHDVQMILALIGSVTGEWSYRNEIEPPVVVEIGCNEGQTTADIARNFPEVRVLGVDIPDGGRMDPAQRGEAPADSRIGIRAEGLANVRILRKPSWCLEWSDIRNGLCWEADAPGVLPALEPERWKAPTIFFIDGDHSFAGVRSDTLLCYEILRRTRGGGMLIWHDDYEGSPEWCGVRRYLNQQPFLRVIRIPDTWVSFAVVRPLLFKDA